ncbi:MAG: hypothetical protein ACYSWP_01040 [Planctomycetota bacterium]|jgi:Glu-tRNA(Gln) amidotransferase subunit E-like FAD-binding protein
MLIGALIILLLSSGNDLANQNLVAHIDTYVNKNIKETSRQYQLLSIVNSIKKARANSTQQTNSTIKSLIELDKDYASNREQFEKLFKEFNQNQQNNYKAILDLRFKLKEGMTRAEWEAAFAKP